ncbi:MAG: hypothetical protein LBE21_00670 [Pseudomonadales bacterium]|jgi:hypothetical protein|nr:hypothetical protein [Pseudomonadales bacterium]
MTESPRELDVGVVVALLSVLIAVTAGVLIFINGDRWFPALAPAPDVPSIAGDWYDDIGYTYFATQQADEFQYRMLQGGAVLSRGGGIITELGELEFNYSDIGDSGGGYCIGVLEEEDSRVVGKCVDEVTGEEWDFDIKRVLD